MAFGRRGNLGSWPKPALGNTVLTRYAHSIDGRRFRFEGPLEDALAIGTYVQIDTQDGRSYLGQVLHETVVSGGSDPGARARLIEGGGVMLARLTDGASVRVEGSDVFGEGVVVEASTDVVRSHLELARGSTSSLTLGELTTMRGLSAELAASGFGRHGFLCGQSGSGKTYTTGKILEQLLLETDLRIAVLDPNSDYVRIAELRPIESTGLTDHEYADLQERYASIASGIHVFGGIGAPLRLQARFGRLTLEQQTMVLGLDPIADPEEYNAFVRIVTDIPHEDYSFEDVLDRVRDSFGDDERRLGMRIVNLGVSELSIWARSDEAAIREELPGDWRMVVFDLGSLPSDRERSIAAAAVLGELWEQRAQRQPLLIVIDEAHNICPQEPSTPNQALATDHTIRIAGEGRKFGKYLLVATQRPEKVHQNVVSQCDNLVLMRMNSVADIEHLKRAFSFVPETLIEQASGFGLGEGLVAGKIAPNPLRFKTGLRYTVEGGSDVPSTWARPSN